MQSQIVELQKRKRKKECVAPVVAGGIPALLVRCCVLLPVSSSSSSSFVLSAFLSAFIPRPCQSTLDFLRVKSAVGKSHMKPLSSLETERIHSLSLSYFLVSLAISFTQSENCVSWNSGSGKSNAGAIQVISWSLTVSLWFLLSFWFPLLWTKVSWRPLQLGCGRDRRSQY